MIRHLCVVIGLLTLGWVAPGSAESLHWYRGDTHAHTINSAGGASPKAVIGWYESPDSVMRWYKENDYQFVFVTDHEYVTDVAPLNAVFGASERFIVLPGQEVTQWIEGSVLRSAHVNSLFARQVVWPLGERKCPGGDACGAYAPATTPITDTFRANISSIRTQGAIAKINHPNVLWTVRPEDLRDVPDQTLIEIWNGFSGMNNLGGDDGSGDLRPSAEALWDKLLSWGKVVWGVASDDSHRESDRGTGWIVVHAATLSSEAIRGAISRGNFYASNGVTLDDVSVAKDSLSLQIHVDEAEPAYAPRYLTRFIGQGGIVLGQSAGTKPEYRFRGDETYVRAAIIDSNGKRAWTQPVFRDGREQ